MIAEELGEFIAGHGAEQCGFCNPGFIMNIIAMEREFNLQKGEPIPSEDDIRSYLVGNLCRCSVMNLSCEELWIILSIGMASERREIPVQLARTEKELL